MERKKCYIKNFVLLVLTILLGITFSNQMANAATTPGGQEIAEPSAANNYGHINYGLMNNELAKIVLGQTEPLTYLNHLVTINQGGVVVYKSFSEMMSGTNGSSSVNSGTTASDVTYYLKNGGINVQTGEIFNLKIRFYTSDGSPLGLLYQPNDTQNSMRYPSNRKNAPIIWIEQTALDSLGNAVPNLNWITTTQLLIGNEVAVFKLADAPYLFNLDKFPIPSGKAVSEPASGATMTSDGYIIMGGTGSVGGYLANIFHPNVGWSGGSFIKNKTTITLGIGTSNYVHENSPYLPTAHNGFVVPNTSYIVPYINESKTLLEMTNQADSYSPAGDHTVGIMFPSLQEQKMIQYIAVNPITGEKTKLIPSSTVDTIPSLPVADTKFVTPITGPAIPGYTFKKLKIQDETNTTGQGIFAHGYTYIEYQYVKNSSVQIHYQDEKGNKIAESEVLKGNVGDLYDTSNFRKEIADYELVQLPTETGIYQNDPIIVTYTYRKTVVTLHIKQVVLNSSDKLVAPTKGYVSINHVNQLKPEDVSSVETITNITLPSKLSDKEEDGVYKITRSKTHDFYQVALLLPEYYESKGYVLTDTKTPHNQNMKQQGMPVFNGKEKIEYWLTLYIEPSTHSIGNFSWDCQIIEKNLMSQ